MIAAGVIGMLLAPISDKMHVRYFWFWNTTLYWKEAALLALIYAGWLHITIACLLQKAHDKESEKKSLDDSD